MGHPRLHDLQWAGPAVCRASLLLAGDCSGRRCSGGAGATGAFQLLRDRAGMETLQQGLGGVALHSWLCSLPSSFMQPCAHSALTLSFVDPTQCLLRAHACSRTELCQQAMPVPLIPARKLRAIPFCSLMLWITEARSSRWR